MPVPSAQEGKPVGTVYVGLAGPDGTAAVVALELVGDRAAIQDRTCEEALDCAGRAQGRNCPGKNQASGSVGPEPQGRRQEGERMVLFRRLLGDVLRDKRTQRGLTLREVSPKPG